MPKTLHNDMTTRMNTIRDRLQTVLLRTAPSTTREGSGNYATSTRQDNLPSKIRARNNITIGTWNVRTLHAVGKMEELEHDMERYHWNILGISETRWKNQGETTTNDGHIFYYSGKDDKHEHGVGFLIHKDTVNSVMGCRPVSIRIITIRIRASPFNITIIQAYAPTSDYADTEIETFYEQLPEVFDETPKKGILIVQGD